MTEALDKLLAVSKTVPGEQVKSAENCQKLVLIVHNLINTQSKCLTKECSELMSEPKTHEAIKSCSPRQFIKSEKRNQLLLHSLLSFSNLSHCDLERVHMKKLERLCLAYETILSTRNLRLVTMPSLSKNLRLLKLTHNKALVNSVGYPSGGKYHTIQKLANKDLPELCTPSGDFCSTDDNIQIKRIVAARNLTENFKFSVKVVNNHAFFQTSDDKVNSILKNPSLQPKMWLRQPNPEDVSQFVDKIQSYQEEANKVRASLLSNWLTEEVNSWGDLVHRLKYLRSSDKGNIWPCQMCSQHGRLFNLIV